ncbi:ZDHHC17 isoform 8 [Pan troglodytes]|uniref:Zinc finger DHHC-type palmitoyltransferase 17 n=4 Tax=Hominidae TaxID=9604 RepID=F8VUG7_HUMAN|nr:ZDHHC17 isoform 8 [Pan troglodytes]PNJ63656.1 ZDHHC17 isoform 2 [Pongo abelii]
MQREEGFNTKMADGPDEYDTEAGCVPLLHPEIWNI